LYSLNKVLNNYNSIDFGFKNPFDSTEI
jgi:hypothetical protein